MPALNGLLFLATLVIVIALFPSLSWPWPFALPLLIYGVLVLAIGPLRRTAARLGMGRMSGLPLLFAAAIGVGAPAVLVIFHFLFEPDVTRLAARLPTDLIRNLFITGVVFSVINAGLEEVIFRGILWDATAQEWNPAIALIVTSILFGVGHYDGYPPGVIGAVLAGLYGLTLGLLRWWTGGLGLAMLCHIAADATIFWLLTI